MNRQPTPRPRPYEPPKLIRVHVDPVKELLLQTGCQPDPDTCPPPQCSGGGEG
jgi:hypothetical protein